MRKLWLYIFLAACGGSGEADSGGNDSADNRGNNGQPPGQQGDGEDDDEAPPSEEPEGSTWLQLSTDDSTSMASPQLFKAGLEPWNLWAHEFINYYDPPRHLFDAEPWAVSDEHDGLELGMKAVEQGDGLELLFQLRAPYVDHATRRPWNLFFCVDVSGSMAGDDKIGFVQDALHLAVSHLKEGDRVTIVSFDDIAYDVLVDHPIGSGGEDATLAAAIDSLAPGASTNMIAGLERSYELAQDHFDHAALQRVLLFGDGNANVGDTDVASFAALTRINDQEGIYLSSVGVGLDFDWSRMDELADAGKGASVFLPNADEVALIFGDYFDKLVEVAADEVSIELELPAGITLAGFTGEETSTDPNAPVQRIILAAGDDLTFLASFDVASEAALDGPGELVVRYVPLGTGQEVVLAYELDHFGELVTEAGPLHERTRAVAKFARYATGGATADAVEQAIAACDGTDAGLTEIGSLVP